MREFCAEFLRGRRSPSIAAAEPQAQALSSAVRSAEIKPDEYRVALTPAGALELVNRGHEVVVETGAGRRQRVRRRRLRARRRADRARSTRCGSRRDLLLKVKEPVAAEYARLREGLTLFTYLHIAADEPLTRALVELGHHRRRLRDGRDAERRAAAARADVRDRRPARVAGGRVLPREAVRRARAAARRRARRRAAARVVIIGGGIVGYNAAIIAIGLGAQVTILERSIDRMRHLEEILSGRVTLLMSSSLEIAGLRRGRGSRHRRRADPGRARAEARHARDDRGHEGRARSSSTSRSTRAAASRPRTPTTHSDPVYVVDGVIHYCVANMPGGVPVTSTMALTNATLPYVEAIADLGLRAAVAADPALAKGVNVLDGKVTYEAVAEAHGLEFTPLDDALALGRLARRRRASAGFFFDVGRAG